MSEPLVSVKMLTYNHAPYIAEAIEGVLQQKTNFPFELVIGEDCSTDGTREIVFEYQKKHPDIIRVVTSDKNVGAKKNSLRVNTTCKGKYIAFCEGDDYWHNPLKMQKQADYLEAHPECGLVYSSYDVNHLAQNKKIKDYLNYRNWQLPRNPRVYEFVNNRDMSECILTCTVMARRILVEKIIESDHYLHQSGHFMMGDTQLWAEISNVSDVYFIPESLATYNISGESASRSNNIIKQMRFSISCDEMFIYLCNKYEMPYDIRMKHENSWCATSLRLAFLTRNSALADEVRRKKKTLTWKEWFRYYGAKHRMMHYTYRIASEVLEPFRKKRNQ